MAETAKLLYVVRHAKSSWTDAALDDRDRPLAPRGQRAARLLADHFSRAAVAPALVLCSPARRAAETLAALQPALGDAVTVKIDDAIYGADADELLDVLHHVPADVPSVMLVGHNPGLQHLVLSLVGSPGSASPSRIRAKFPTGAVATLRFEGAWEALANGQAELVEFVTPHDLA
jgi:phosphohistidine phosphatase